LSVSESVLLKTHVPVGCPTLEPQLDSIKDHFPYKKLRNISAFATQLR